MKKYFDLVKNGNYTAAINEILTREDVSWDEASDCLINVCKLKITSIRCIHESGCLLFSLNNDKCFSLHLSFFPQLKQLSQNDWNVWKNASGGAGNIEFKNFTNDISLKNLLYRFFEEYGFLTKFPICGENTMNLKLSLHYYMADTLRNLNRELS